MRPRYLCGTVAPVSRRIDFALPRTCSIVIDDVPNADPASAAIVIVAVATGVPGDEGGLACDASDKPAAPDTVEMHAHSSRDVPPPEPVRARGA